VGSYRRLHVAQFEICEPSLVEEPNLELQEGGFFTLTSQENTVKHPWRGMWLLMIVEVLLSAHKGQFKGHPSYCPARQALFVGSQACRKNRTRFESCPSGLSRQDHNLRFGENPSLRPSSSELSVVKEGRADLHKLGSIRLLQLIFVQVLMSSTHRSARKNHPVDELLGVEVHRTPHRPARIEKLALYLDLNVQVSLSSAQVRFTGRPPVVERQRDLQGLGKL
jgi:hypothetical protein